MYDLIGSLLGALITGLIALSIYSKQNKNAEEIRRRTQAENITGWLKKVKGSDIKLVALLNNSYVPVYQVIVSVVTITDKIAGDAREDFIDQFNVAILPPNNEHVQVKANLNDFDLSNSEGKIYSLEIAFTDSTGIHWLRSGDGKLKEIKESPVKYYRLNKRHIYWKYVGAKHREDSY